jgi:ADP-ribose pyrophosphatase YjhB (NUDIX family)
VFHIPCVAIIIENSKKEFLLLLRDDKLGLSFAKYWTLIGGRVEDGETPEIAAHRELLEKTGLKMELFFWKRYNRISPQAPVNQYIYTLEKLASQIQRSSLEKVRKSVSSNQKELNSCKLPMGSILYYVNIFLGDLIKNLAFLAPLAVRKCS